ncbi:MAG: GerAB/ArcD/ProY family transporter [Bacillota bacterium]
MFANNQKIAVQQLYTLCLFYFFNTTLLFLPSEIVLQVKESSGFVVLFWCAVSVLLAYFLLYVGKTIPEFTAIEWYTHTFGQWFGKLIGGFLIFTLLFYGALELRIFSEIIIGYLLPKTPLLLVLALFGISIYYSASRGIETMGRVSEILAFFVILPFAVILISVLLSLGGDYSRILPMTMPSAEQLSQGGAIFSPMFQGLLLLLFVFPYLEEQKKHVRGVALLTLVMGGVVLLVLFLNLGVYGYEVLGKKLLPTLQMMERVSFSGIFLTRQDSFFLWFWFASTVIFLSGMVFFATTGAISICNRESVADQTSEAIDNETDYIKKHKLPTAVATLIVILLAWLPKDLSVTYVIRNTLVPWCNGVFLFVLPCICLFIEKIKRGVRK